jgi:hypothetical protein
VKRFARRGNVANGYASLGDCGVKAAAMRFRGARKCDSKRHDGTRLAHARWRLTRDTEWGLGSPGLTRRVSAQADPRRRKLPFGVGPENGGARDNDQRRERSGSTERGSTSRGQYGAGGRHRRPRARPQGPAIGHAPPAVSGESRCPARCIGTRSAEAEAPHRASPPIGSPARTAGTAQSLSSNYGFASPCGSARDEGARSKC